MQVQDMLEAAAAADTIAGWNGRHMSALQSARPAFSLEERAALDQRGAPMSALFAVTTANVWRKTELLLHSLATIKDSFEILVWPGATAQKFSH